MKKINKIFYLLTTKITKKFLIRLKKEVQSLNIKFLLQRLDEYSCFIRI